MMANSAELSPMLEELEAEIAQAERSYQAQSGGASICQLQKDGRVTGGIKYDEGRLIALSKARRLLQTGGGLSAIADECRTWREGLSAQQGKEHPAVPWVAYLQGGVDALEWVLKGLEAR